MGTTARRQDDRRWLWGDLTEWIGDQVSDSRGEDQGQWERPQVRIRQAADRSLRRHQSKDWKAGHRWWAITGEVYADADTIERGTDAINWICSEYLLPERPGASPNASNTLPPRGSSDIRERAIAYIQTCDPSVSGERGHDTAFRIACALVLGFDLDPDDAFAIMRDHWNDRCDPPWSESELRHKVESANGQPGERGHLRNAERKRHDAFDRMVEKIVASAQDATKPSGGEWIGDPQQQSHNALAVQFINRHGVDLRFVRKWKCWIVWDGKRWRKDESGRDALRFGRRFAHSLWQLIGDFAKTIPERNEVNKCITFVKTMNQQTHIDSFLKMASADRRVLMDHDDLNPDPMLINVANGTIDLRTGEHRGFRQSDLITMIADVEFVLGAECPQWIAFLEMIFRGDAELIRYVQQVLGYSLTGDTGAHILPIAWGGGSNGKSTLTGVIVRMLGEYATIAEESLLLGRADNHSCEKAGLYQKRFVAISEPEDGGKLREARVKEMTGDAFISARGMRENPWTFQRTFTFWMSTNHKPQVGGTDEGIWRRIKLIEFLVDIRKLTKPIDDYDRQLFEKEGPGILNWLIAGCLDHQANGFVEPECVKMAVEQYRHEEDQLAEFIDECCITGQAGYRVQASKLYEAYTKWAGHGEAMTKTKFGREMGKRFEREDGKSGGKRDKRFYCGITLTEPDHDDRF